ncbi:Cation-efflux pump FieF [Gammaproteobacteria bacterium]
MTELSNVSPSEAGVLLRRASRASVATAMILVFAKLGAWLATGAASLLATLIDSLLDTLASLTNLLALHYALQPADREHRFGHGKLESLAGLAQALFIGGSGMFLISEALNRLFHPRPLTNTGIGIMVMVFAMIATYLLLRFQHRVIRVTSSTAIRADSLHYGTDLLTNGAVLVALAYERLFDWEYLDPILALGIAIYVLYSAGQIAWEAGQLLMDRELPELERELIVRLAREHPEVRGVSELKTRRAGTTVFIQFQLEICGSISLEKAHHVTEEVESKINAHFPNAEIHIHQEPKEPIINITTKAGNL